ncbi:MAG: hypothetical protein HZC02_01210 [Candidatus Levybacteria bacterium]|nr:hypothetical protein [Candidatus Levybacteria bacterium]
MSSKNLPEAMAFYHEAGLPAAWKQAMKFTEPSGRLATMPDITMARLATMPGSYPWERYFTTLTAEYYGLSKNGRRILIVAHGVGPMANLDGILKAYSWEYNDKDRNRHGGRITQQEFWDLEAGKYGPVEIIDIQGYCQTRQYPFISILRASDAFVDPILHARLGPDALTYITAHTEASRLWHKEQAGIDPENRFNLPDYNEYLIRREKMHFLASLEDSDPYIIGLKGSSFLYYLGRKHGFQEPEEGYAVAHLVSTTGLAHAHHEGNESLVLDVSLHGWSDGVRLVGIRPEGSTKNGIHQDADPRELLKKYWQRLFKSAGNQHPINFCGLVQLGDEWFTQYPKKGAGLDTYEPEYKVTFLYPIGTPVPFVTDIKGHYMFFKFDINELKAIAPPQANGYFFTNEPELVCGQGNPTHQTIMVQFYKVWADTTKRLKRESELAHDYQTMLDLAFA